MIVRKVKLSPTTSDVNLDGFDSDLSWLQMVPSTIKASPNQSDSHRTKEDKILTYILSLIIPSPEDSPHQSRKHKQETISNDSNSTQPTSSPSKLRTYRNYPGKNLLDAIEEVRSGSMSAIKASRKYGVPERTLYAKVKEIRDLMELYISYK